jgi:hypothetical protein
MSTIPNKCWAEGRIYAPTENDKLFEAISRYHKASEKDNKATLICNAVHEATVIVFMYSSPVTEMPTAFHAFDDITFLTQMVPPGCYTIYEVNNLFEGVTATEPKR